ncbi:uncharacterized protein LOC134183815 [Corticium candelabrum]|uniref:uncharacterized protein LOC134183815 n=1 Tax=Corticium candelabrum TaxID=121492 RepID=UPI002E26E7FF|nr:uncharacterized protein LOC134183815 [Corticium candelabrum]
MCFCAVAARGTEITEGKERRNALVGVKRMVRVKDGSASSCLLACFIVVIIVVFNCLPTIFFALYARDNSNELESTHTHSQDNISLGCDEQRVQQFSELLLQTVSK